MQSPPTELLTNFFVIWETVATKPTGLIAILAHEPECSLLQCVQYSVKHRNQSILTMFRAYEHA